ncbi:MAG: bifunctional pyr operon transcriptional regulator/uracil phosphoribosyltransferase PyrR [Deltaproteobacteria bacterium]|nr:bifunctional pyr operon transcriptional regulator/uracil phosphoribosyltransferase PyrR [Deltaproteobacteria bacterium]
MTEKEMDDAMYRIAAQIVEHGTDGVVLIGIRTRGVPLANWLAKKVEQIQKKPIPVGQLDINLYRDDLSEVGDQPIVQRTELPFKLTGLGIILVDDVLYTGRTIRAAMDAIIDFGRPKFIRLMTMIDRGWREFPIQPDYVGKRIDTEADDNVKVQLAEMDGENKVVIRKQLPKQKQ